MNTLWTVDDLAKRYNVARERVYRWRAAGRAPRARMIGRQLFFTEADVIAWEESHVEPEPETS